MINHNNKIFDNPDIKKDLDFNGNNYLTMAAHYTNFETFQFILKTLNFDINSLEDEVDKWGGDRTYRNSFHGAIIGGNKRMLYYLNKLNPDLKSIDADGYGKTSLGLAAEYADLSTVVFLVEEIGVTPVYQDVFCAIWGAKLENLKYLVSLESKYGYLKYWRIQYGSKGPKGDALKTASMRCDPKILRYRDF